MLFAKNYRATDFGEEQTKQVKGHATVLKGNYLKKICLQFSWKGSDSAVLLSSELQKNQEIKKCLHSLSPLFIEKQLHILLVLTETGRKHK